MTGTNPICDAQDRPGPEIEFVKTLRGINPTQGGAMTSTRSSDGSRPVATLIHIIAERWCHAATEVKPQVFKDAPPPRSFYLVTCSPRLHSSSPSPSSPLFFISCQMISETSLIPRPTASSFPSISRTHSLIVCPSFTLSFVSAPLSPSMSVSPLLTFLFSPSYSPFHPRPTSLSLLLPLFGINILLFSEPFCFTSSHPLNPPHFRLIFAITLP